ncbi:MAG: translesion error-prone DNA polymerase V autoproteolytic subunit [Arenicellales bacterium]
MAIIQLDNTATHNVAGVWQCPDPLPESLKISLFECPVEAGFPSPAEDHIEATLDLNELLIEHPAATFFVRVAGESMLDAGIHPNDVLIVDRSETPKHGSIVIALVNGEYTVKRLYMRAGEVKLCPENKQYSPIELSGFDELEVWGVVTGLTRKL